jgi:group II intron reverse transcriptase/maturase
MGENVGELKKMLYDMAKANPERRFHSLYDKIWKMDVLTEAWEAVESNHGSPGIDGVKIEDIDREIEGVLAQLQAELRTRTYEPAPLKRVYIPKPNGKMRGLAIPTVRDRIVQAAVKIVMEPIFESYFEPCSFGFRPNRSAHDAVNEAAKYLNYGCEHVIDINIKGCFDNIPRDKLMDQVALRISHGSVLHLIRRILDAGIMEGGEIIDTEKGTPRGSPLSSLLANIYPLTNWTRHGNCLVWPIGMKRMRIPSDMQMMLS